MSDPLLGVLSEARSRGLLGPGELHVHLTQALGFGERIATGARVLDLGSGAGVPGLPLLVNRADLDGVLADAARRRIEFLDWAVAELDLGARVSTRWGRAEDLARLADLRESFDAVLSRSFGPPGVAAECARGFIRPGGILVVSEPPSRGSGDTVDAERWPQGPLGSLGFELGSRYESGGYGFQLLLAAGDCPDRFPRRSGIPSKRPLF